MSFSKFLSESELTYDILYARRGDKSAQRHMKTVRDEKEALKIANNLKKFPPDTINIVVTCDDGRTIYDHQKDFANMKENEKPPVIGVIQMPNGMWKISEDGKVLGDSRAWPTKAEAIADAKKHVKDWRFPFIFDFPK